MLKIEKSHYGAYGQYYKIIMENGKEYFFLDNVGTEESINANALLKLERVNAMEKRNEIKLMTA